MATFLNKYTKFLEAPKTGPDIASVTVFTPFALLVQQSNQHASGYSAQQAALDHRDQGEFVRILVQIQLTASYASFIVRPTGSHSGSPNGFVPAPMTSGRISMCKSPATTKSSGPSLLPAIPTSSAPMTAVAKLRAPLSSSTSPPSLCLRLRHYRHCSSRGRSRLHRLRPRPPPLIRVRPSTASSPNCTPMLSS